MKVLLDSLVEPLSSVGPVSVMARPSSASCVLSTLPEVCPSLSHTLSHFTSLNFCLTSSLYWGIHPTIHLVGIWTAAISYDLCSVLHSPIFVLHFPLHITLFTSPLIYDEVAIIFTPSHHLYGRQTSVLYFGLVRMASKMMGFHLSRLDSLEIRNINFCLHLKKNWFKQTFFLNVK